MRKHLHRLRGGPLAHPDQHRAVAEHQDVPALDGGRGRVLPVVPDLETAPGEHRIVRLDATTQVVLNGSTPLVVKGTPDAYRMPQFRLQLSDQQIADVVSYIRAGWGNKASPVTAAQVADLRKSTDPTSDQVVILRMR